MQFSEPTLVVVHYHYRSGGVRRVIERALPGIVADKVARVVLVGGSPAPDAWIASLRDACTPAKIEQEVLPGIGYTSELDRPASAKHIARDFRKILGRGRVLAVWAHNLGLARNVALAEGLTAACTACATPMVSHHHDLWCDNRWSRWQEVRAAGCRTLARLAAVLFPSAPGIVHATINRADHRLFHSAFGRRAAWFPNPFDLQPLPAAAKIRDARRWLDGATGAPRGSKLWLLPCRLVRRKNIAEAMFLARLLDRRAVVATTGGPSTEDERPYTGKLAAAAGRHGWPLHLCLMDNGPGTPPIDSVIAACDVVLLTSVQEGFGLAYLEAAAARRPLICRELPNVMPDLHRFGFSFPHSYRELSLPADWIDYAGELRRQKEILAAWKASLPHEVRPLAGRPPVLALAPNPARVPFSRLTLTAQIEAIEAAPPQQAADCPRWTSRTWPQAAAQLSGAAYARRFWETLGRGLRGVHRPADPRQIQDSIIRDRLGDQNLFPILMARQT